VTIAIRNEALPSARTGNNKERTRRERNDRDGSPACVTPHRESHGQRRNHPVAMINKKAIPCTHPFEVLGFPPLSIGVSTLNGASSSATPTGQAARPRNCSPA
jgi:hypothetical protein